MWSSMNWKCSLLPGGTRVAAPLARPYFMAAMANLIVPRDWLAPGFRVGFFFVWQPAAQNQGFHGQKSSPGLADPLGDLVAPTGVQAHGPIHREQHRVEIIEIHGPEGDFSEWAEKPMLRIKPSFLAHWKVSMAPSGAKMVLRS